MKINSIELLNQIFLEVKTENDLIELKAIRERLYRLNDKAEMSLESNPDFVTKIQLQIQLQFIEKILELISYKIKNIKTNTIK